MDVDEPLMKEWVVRIDRDAYAYTSVPTTMRSISQTRSMKSKTSLFLQQLNTNQAMKVIN